MYSHSHPVLQDANACMALIVLCRASTLVLRRYLIDDPHNASFLQLEHLHALLERHNSGRDRDKGAHAGFFQYVPAVYARRIHGGLARSRGRDVLKVDPLFVLLARPKRRFERLEAR